MMGLGYDGQTFLDVPGRLRGMVAPRALAAICMQPLCLFLV